MLGALNSKPTRILAICAALWSCHRPYLNLVCALSAHIYLLQVVSLAHPASAKKASKVHITQLCFLTTAALHVVVAVR